MIQMLVESIANYSLLRYGEKLGLGCPILQSQDWHRRPFFKRLVVTRIDRRLSIKPEAVRLTFPDTVH